MHFGLFKGAHMKRFLALLLLVTGITCLHASNIDLSISKGMDQAVIIQLTPSPAQTDVWNNAKIEVSFNVPIDASSVQKNNIKLVHLSSKTNDHIDGAISYDKYDNKVVLTPSTLLPVGTYEVEIKSLKADKDYKTTQIKEIKYRFYVPEVINGHQLPPEPDPVVNNSTLLGIDANGNGVRDDVERWIYNRFQSFENAGIDRAIAMQYAKATQIIIQEPEKAYETKNYQNMHDAIDCQWYYFDRQLKDIKDYFKRMKYRQEHYIFDDEMKDVIFSTRERLEAYMKYNNSLSGHTYKSRPIVKEKCDFDIDIVWKQQ